MNELLELFEVLDLDGNGYVDPNELSDWIKNEANMKIDSEKLFKEIDKNGNGKIAPEELAEYYKDMSKEDLEKVTESLYDRHASRLAKIRNAEAKDEFDIEVPFVDDPPSLPKTEDEEEINKNEQRSKIREILEQHTKEKEGEIWFCISSKWYENWKEYVSYDDIVKNNQSQDNNNQSIDEDGDINAMEIDGGDLRQGRLSRSLSFQLGSHPGPIDNSDIAGESNGELKLGISEHYDFALLPEEAWKNLLQWYGGGPAYPRHVIGLPNGNSQIDLWPCFLVVVWCDSVQGKPNPKTVTRKVVSRNTTIKKMMEEFGENVRLWIKRKTQNSEKDEYQWCLVNKDSWNMTLLDANFVSGDTLLLEAKNEVDKWPRGNVTEVATKKDEHDFRDFQVGDNIDACDTQKKWYRSTIRDVKKTKVFVHYEGWSSKWDEWIAIDSDRLAPLGTHTEGVYVSKSQKASWSYARDLSEDGKPLALGVVGLRNLGNTCFMNSTLQCLLNAKSITEFFLNDQYLKEINKDNPLGHMGRVADEYGKLVKQVYSNKYSVIAPSGFKHTIGEFAPQFAGFQQHDSSELLSFLLDGLHEDLNRVKKKPYTQDVESNDRPDDVVAKESWETYLKRNDSHIVDTMTGQLKSTIVCPTCDRVSVKFDPYLYLSVPLPIETTRTIPITFVPFDGTTPTFYGVTIDKRGTNGDLLKAFVELANVDINTIRLAEIQHHHVRQTLSLNHPVSYIRSSDTIYAFEVIVPEAKQSDEAEQHFKEMKVGQIIDAKDTERKWYEADIVEAEEDRIKVHYAGWSSKWDEWHEKTSDRLAPRHTHSKVHILEIDCHHKGRGYDTFGVPFYVCVQPNTVTNRELRNDILERCKKIIKGDPNELDESKEPLVQIRIRSGHYSCGKCSKRSCDGCVLPDDDELVTFDSRKRSLQFIVEWNDPDKFDREKGEAIIRHSSAPKLDTKNGRVDSKTLADCLDVYIKEEILSKDDAWYCSKCKEFQQASKKFDIYSLPDVLVIHLKRFSYTKYWREKIGTFIDFPLENLDLSKYVIGEENVPVYDLLGVSNHMGGLHGGHYIASIKKGDKWFNCDDSRVSEMDADDVPTKAAYLLFYQRRK